MVRWSDGQMVRWSDGQTVHKILPVLFCALLASKGYILLVWLSLRWAKARVTRFERVKEHITDSQSLHTSYPVYDCVEYSKSESGPPDNSYKRITVEHFKSAHTNQGFPLLRGFIRHTEENGVHHKAWLQEYRGWFTYTHMFPVKVMCGQRCGLHMTATTAIFGTAE